MNWQQPLNRQPSPRELYHFGLTALLALPVAGWLFSRGNLYVAGSLALLGAILALLGRWHPPAIRPIYLVAMALTAPIGYLVSEIVLLLTFVLVLIPIGLVLRLRGRDALHLKLDRTRKSYWQPKRQPRGAASYFRQS